MHTYTLLLTLVEDIYNFTVNISSVFHSQPECDCAVGSADVTPTNLSVNEKRPRLTTLYPGHYMPNHTASRTFSRLAKCCLWLI